MGSGRRAAIASPWGAWARCAILAAAWCGFSSAWADDLRAGERLYAVGSFLEAARVGEAAGSAAGRRLAVRALLARCLTASDPAERARLLVRVLDQARAVLAEDSGSVEARLQLATAIGLRARTLGLGQALREGLAPQGRRLIEEALASDPRHPWAHALLGGWHFEVLRRGGAAGALAFGAREREGLLAFETAMALAPEDPVIALQAAGALLAHDAARHAPRVRAALQAAAGAPARDAFEAHAAHTAAVLLERLESAGPQAAADAALALAP
jgi:hypothetical protein